MPSNDNLDYYYDTEAGQYSFYHIDTILLRPCLKIDGMPNGERFFRQSRQIFAGGLTPGKKI